MKIRVLGNFKTGTSSLLNILETNESSNDYTLLKGKHIACVKNADTIIVPIRKHYDIFISAFFQDIDKESYRYFYNKNRDIILKEDNIKLVNFFKNIEWDKESHLCFYEVMKHLNKYLIIEDEIIFGQCDKYVLKQFKSKDDGRLVNVLFIKFVYIKKEEVQKIFKDVFNFDIKFYKRFFHSNRGSDKWYSKKYNDFKLCLFKNGFDEYRNKYKYLDKNLFDY